MSTRFILHFVGGDSRQRAEQSRLAFSLGHHAEIHADIDELLDRPPQAGVIVANEDVVALGITETLERLGEAGIWLPLVAAGVSPDVDEVVQAIREGALDYLRLPLTRHDLRRVAASFHSDGGRHAEARRRLVQARRRIGALSNREREVLDWLAEGNSNKAIARVLDISPRTVEIHRANMMGKLGAQHMAEAVRLRVESGLNQTSESGPADTPTLILGRRAGGPGD